MGLSLTMDMSLRGALGRAGSSVPPQVSAFLTRANAVTTLDATHTAAYTALISGLVSAGVWSKLDALYIFATQSSGVALLNLISSSYTATLTSTPPAFQADKGFTGNGGAGSTNAGIDTNFNPTTAPSPNYTQDSAHISTFNFSIGIENKAIATADTTGATTAIYPEFSSGATYMRINDASASNPISSTPDGSGHYVMSRNSSSIRKGYWNGVSLGTANSATSAAPPNATVKFLGSSSVVGSLKQVSMASVGGQLSDADASALYSLTAAYFNAVAPITGFTTAAVNTNVTPETQGNILQTTDGSHFVVPAGVTNPVITFPSGGGTGTTSTTVGAQLMFARGKYWMCYEMNDFSHTQLTFGISSATSLNGPWTWVCDVPIYPSFVANSIVWDPHWFIDDDGSVHITCYAAQGAGLTRADTPYIVDCLNTTTFASWSAATAITGSTSGFPNQNGDFYLLAPSQNPTGKYAMWYRNYTNGFFELATSTSLKSGYALVSSNPFGHPANTYEGIAPIKIAPNLWRMYFFPIGVGQGWQYQDSYDNWTTYSPLFNTSLFLGNYITTGPVLVGPT